MVKSLASSTSLAYQAETSVNVYTMFTNLIS